MIIVVMYPGLRRASLAALLALGVAVVVVVSGCAAFTRTDQRTDGRLKVVVAFYPLQFVAQQVGGDRVRVTDLVQPGVEPHDLELKPRQVAQVVDADAVIYLADFQPAVDSAVGETTKRKALDVSAVSAQHDGYVPVEEGKAQEKEKGKDPHVWLDPIRMARITDAVAKKFAALDPAHAAEYTTNAHALDTKLAALDGEYTVGLANCPRKTLVVSHNAFGYLAQRYGLDQVPITGLTPDEEASATRLAEVATYARKNGVTVIFFETLVSPKIAEALAREVGAKAEVLDPIEGIAANSDANYLTVMRSNLTTLRSALSCR